MTEREKLPAAELNSLRSIRGLHSKVSEEWKYFPSIDVFANKYHLPHTWRNPMWGQKESPTNPQEAEECLESLCQRGYLDKVGIPFTEVRDVIGYRIKKDKMPEVEKILAENN